MVFLTRTFIVLVFSFSCVNLFSQSTFLGGTFPYADNFIDDFSIKSGKGEVKIHDIGQIYSDFAVEFDVVPANSESKFGIVIFDRDTSRGWNYIGCDLTSDILCYSHWFIQTPSSKRLVAKDIAKFYKGYKRHVKIECFSNIATIYIDGEKIAEAPFSASDKRSHKLAFRAHNGADVSVSGVKLYDIGKIKKNKIKANSDLRLSSEYMQVSFCADYPAVDDYLLFKGNNRVSGASMLSNTIIINGYRLPIVSRVKNHGDKIVYNSRVENIGVDFTTEFSVDKNILLMKISDIKESGVFKVKTISFPDHDLVTMSNSDNGAILSIADNVIKDEFIPLKGRSDDTVSIAASIAILNNDSYAVTIDNNSIYNGKQIKYRTDNGVTSLFSNEWIYRGIDGKKLPLPWVKVIFADDANGDGMIDWQDGALALSEVYPVPYGADMVRNSYATITMNFASGGQYPFLRQLDNIKKFYLATDGFPQMLELKGYQSEGHDSGHPDYAGNYNRRAGGLADLQFLTWQAKKYNANIGVHLNHSESYPEAKAYDNEIITDIPGWVWLDQAYIINKEADVLRGTFEQRLGQMKRDLPHLSFVYIDTYREHRYLAYNTAKIFNDNQWVVWTEDSDIFFREGAWIHYNPESKSMISRFVQHTFRDGYAKHPFLLGGYGRGAEVGFMGWQKGRDFNGVTERFFMEQLPYRYLMYFGLMQIGDNFAKFKGGVVSSDNNGENTISRNGKDVRRGDVVFIPWSPALEDKIYHYNRNGGVSSWNLPDSWGGLSIVKLYKLDNYGRHFVKDIPVGDNSSVTIEADPKQGYVLYKCEAPTKEVMNWGEGGYVHNPGFDGGLEYWNADSANVENTSYGQTVLRIGGGGKVSQNITLESGADYDVSVWCVVSGKGKATLSVGGKSFSICESRVKNFTDNTDKYGTYYQRIKFPYKHSGTVTELNLSFIPENDTSFVCFDDVRIVKKNLQKNLSSDRYFEDFEDVDEGWGPFVASKSSAYTTHLSQRHDGYTDDVINGEWSLKTWREGDGEVYRTSPSMIKFSSDSEYTLSFAYSAHQSGVYRVSVRSSKDDKELFNEPLNDKNGTFSRDFRTATADDYYVVILKKGNGVLVMDDFLIKGNFNK